MTWVRELGWVGGAAGAWTRDELERVVLDGVERRWSSWRFWEEVEMWERAHPLSLEEKRCEQLRGWLWIDPVDAWPRRRDCAAPAPHRAGLETTAIPEPTARDR